MHGEYVAFLAAGTVLLLLVATIARALVGRTHVPLSVVLFLIGIALAAVGKQVGTEELLERFRLSPGIVLYVFLPSLIFDSAIKLDVKALRRNLVPILTLAVPGLLISTFGIALVLAAATPFRLRTALLLGAILSATDPVAVISVFERLGAPRRLHVLVEGESLFNDATALVVSRILAGLLAGGALTANLALDGLVEFAYVFSGGLATGAILGFATGYVLRMVRSDSFVSISLTTILAYLSFIIAELFLGVSGVVATVTAGLTFSGWSWMRVSHEVRNYLEYFWHYVAFVANALIFLLVGLLVDPLSLWEAVPLLVWVIAGMLVSRLLVSYGLLSYLGLNVTRFELDLRYQTVIYWGGLRGAVAVAIALSLPSFGANTIFLTLVMGAVLFTLLVQGLTIEPLVHLLGLDRPSPRDRFIRIDSQLAAQRSALEALPRIARGGRLSSSILERVEEEYAASVGPLEHELREILENADSQAEQERMLCLRSLGEERGRHVQLFDEGHIGEAALRQLDLEVSLQLDAVRHGASLDELHLGRFHRARLVERLGRLLVDLPLLGPLAERHRRRRFAIDYELSWAHYQSSAHVLERLREEGQLFPSPVIDSVTDRYRRWNETARAQLDTAAEQFPEFVADVQKRFGLRLLLLHERERIVESMEAGALPESSGEACLSHIDERLEQVRTEESGELGVAPEEILRKIPLLQGLPAEAFDELGGLLESHTFPANERIIKRGESGSSLFLLARGVVRVLRPPKDEPHGELREVATLLPGDFFGEMELLRAEPRIATVLAVTPVLAYELRGQDARVVMQKYPTILEALEAKDRERRR
jgi:CPA1 family monovalent cation:H+ antiporter